MALSEAAAAIEPRHLFPEKAASGEADAAPATYEDAMRRYQGRFLREALEQNQWNVSETARRIGVARSTSTTSSRPTASRAGGSSLTAGAHRAPTA